MLHKSFDDLKNYLLLSRPFTCLSSFISVLIGGLYVSNLINIDVYWAGLSAALLAAAGNMFNDVIDVEADVINHPERVLPQKKLSAAQVLMASFLFAFIANLIAAIINSTVFIISVTATILLIIYTIKLKNLTVIGNLAIGILSGLLFAYGAYSNARPVNFPLVIFVTATLGITARELLKTIADYPGDLSSGVKTTVTNLGVVRSLRVYKLLLVLFSFSTMMPILERSLKIEYLILMSVTVYPVLFYTFVKISSFTQISLLRLILRLQKYAFLAWLFGVYIQIKS